MHSFICICNGGIYHIELKAKYEYLNLFSSTNTHTFVFLYNLIVYRNFKFNMTHARLVVPNKESIARGQISSR